MRSLLPDAGPGLYAFLLSTPLGTQRQLHLRRDIGETRTWGANPMIEEWRTGGLVSDWDRAVFADRRSDGNRRRPLDRTLMALGLGLILAGVLVDRMKPRTAAGLGRLPRWWRSRP